MPEDQENIAEVKAIPKPKVGSRQKVKVKVGKTAKKPAVKRAKKPVTKKEKTVAMQDKKEKDEDALLPVVIKPAQPLFTAKIKTENKTEKNDDLAAAKEELKREIFAGSSNFSKMDSIEPKEQKDFTVNPVAAGVAAKVMPTFTGQKAASDDQKSNTTLKSSVEKNKQPLRLYRNIAVTFIAAAIILAIVIGYFAFVRVTITIVPNQENTNGNLIFDVYDQGKNTNTTINGKAAVLGLVRKVTVTVSKNYPATGIDIVGREAVGTTTIYNNYDKSQPLVATTRLLTSDGKLFRISQTVNVPAGGSVVVPIYADQPSQEMAIGPTRFTVPGLWAGLQDKIYAQSDQPIVYQQKVTKHIISDDITNSVADLKQEAINKAQSEASTTGNLDKVIASVDEATIKTKINGKVGAEQDNFDVSLDADVAVIAFSEEKLKELAKENFISLLPDDKEIMSFNDNNIIYSLNNSDWVQGVATLNASYVGKTTLKENSNIVDVNKILGLDKDQLKAYLTSLPDVAGYEIKFTPSWLWKVPQFIETSKIHVEIKN